MKKNIFLTILTISYLQGGLVVLILWRFNPQGDGKWSLGKIVNGCVAGKRLVFLVTNIKGIPSYIHY